MKRRTYERLGPLVKLNDRLVKFSLHRGLGPRANALLETTGRRSGLKRETPVGNGLEGDTFWLVAAHGVKADYVRNIAADPRVRVKVAKTWRTGTAVMLPEDDAWARTRTMPYQWDAALNRFIADEPLTIRIDLDPV